jgi:hypothetical protein
MRAMDRRFPLPTLLSQALVAFDACAGIASQSAEPNDLDSSGREPFPGQDCASLLESSL